MRAGTPNESPRRGVSAMQRNETNLDSGKFARFLRATLDSSSAGFLLSIFDKCASYCFFSSNVVKNLHINRQLSSCFPLSSLDSSLTFVNSLETIYSPDFCLHSLLHCLPLTSNRLNWHRPFYTLCCEFYTKDDMGKMDRVWPPSGVKTVYIFV